ncbi:bifunctional 5,10-methylenetetrahydrofolate dehydrogenase/5,10-methenyltetrahydrofolate cyclohydrolase [candidate division WS5 bacterium]|uniref:Bifunctional protein FolD n=1 Tax=candidate division WS5 bacterium TaxID=2093353 RepID=A0A419DE98_9BACT|nr:MAG: bifunctional 5,10-methylenetetrahydrofolate dehydrogenase/5,10-methenyltetrahydrofolate cyclohydrolase [candidate division WS5 bacterium]
MKSIQEIQKEILKELKTRADKVSDISFAIIQVGENPISALYVKKKEEMAERLGIKCKKFILDEKIDETELIVNIKEINSDTDVSGVIVQLPLPRHIDTRRVLDSIDPDKDIDGLNSENLGKLFTGQKSFYPATPLAVTRLIEELGINVSGKRVVVVGGSNLVGKPLSMLLLNEGATVTTCNSKTRNLKEITQKADILVVAIGRPNFITSEMVKEGSIVIDVGINRADGKVVGDVRKDVSQKAGFLTPVPGGVGPLTIMFLMKNVLDAGLRV